jgi:2C-methyl-D-erythritol 2,4-cyclodiphosphate synthase
LNFGIINNLANESANQWKFVDDMSLLKSAEEILRVVQWKFSKTLQVKQLSQK